jgi:hypothetical protein
MNVQGLYLVRFVTVDAKDAVVDSSLKKRPSTNTHVNVCMCRSPTWCASSLLMQKVLVRTPLFQHALWAHVMTLGGSRCWPTTTRLNADR